jgi:subtilase family serine protease
MIKSARAMVAGLAAGGLILAGCASTPAGRPARGAPASPAGPSAGASAGATADCDSVTTCYAPGQIQVAYGIRPLLDRGIDGRGETVVLPEFAQTRLSPPQVSDIRQDLAQFDRLFGLPAARLRAVTTLAGAATPWLASQEEVADAEIVHAVAPAAAITVLLASPASLSTPQSAVAAAVAVVRFGRSQGDVISISGAGQIGGELCVTHAEVASLNSALQAAAGRHVTVVAAAGDTGAAGEPCSVAPAPAGGSFPLIKEVNLPSSDPLVLAAGGTSLTASHVTGGYVGETAWGLPYGDPGTLFQATGGGVSRLFPRPGYQDGVAGIGATRGVPDVAADASGHSGMALAISDGGGRYAIGNSGGTSASAPLWAALIALADQYAGRPLGFVNPALYRIARSAAYHRAFHDITTGNNTATWPPTTITGYRAGPGWDPVTGLGSPDAQALIPLLARYAGS